MLLPIVLGFSPRLPVSVCGTGACGPSQQLFSPVWIHVLPYLISVLITPQTSRRPYFTNLHPWCLNGFYHQPAHTILLCHCISQTLRRQYRNINLLSIAYDDTVLGLGPD